MIDWLRLREPSGVPQAAYHATLRGVVAFAVSVGVQLTSVAMIAIGPLATPLPSAELTEIGRRNMRPELDLPVFYLGCVATVILVVAGARAWSRLAAHRADARIALAVHWLLAVGSLLAFVGLCHALGGAVGDDGRMPAGDLVGLAVPVLTAMVLWLGYAAGVARRPPATTGPGAPP